MVILKFDLIFCCVFCHRLCSCTNWGAFYFSCFIYSVIYSVAPAEIPLLTRAWWRHQMKTFSALLALCAGNSPVTGEFPAQRPVMRGFDVFFDLRLNKRLSKQSWSWCFETPSRSLWRHCMGPISISAESLSIPLSILQCYTQLIQHFFHVVYALIQLDKT